MHVNPQCLFTLKSDTAWRFSVVNKCPFLFLPHLAEFLDQCMRTKCEYIHTRRNVSGRSQRSLRRATRLFTPLHAFLAPLDAIALFRCVFQRASIQGSEERLGTVPPGGKKAFHLNQWKRHPLNCQRSRNWKTFQKYARKMETRNWTRGPFWDIRFGCMS